MRGAADRAVVKPTREPLRIGYIVQHFPPETGALPARASELASRWRDAGAEVTIYTSMPHRPVGRIHEQYRGHLFVNEWWNGIRVRRSWIFATAEHGIAKTLANNTTFMATSFLSGVLSGSPDVVIASAPGFFVHVAGVVLAKLRRVPVVLEIRDLWPDYVVGMGVLKPGILTRMLFGLERWLLRRARYVIVVTESFRRRVAAKGVPLDRIAVVPNGVDVTQYYPIDEPAPHPSLCKDGARFVVGYLGNFGSGQALSSVVEAAAILERHDPTIRVVLAGDGPERARVLSHAATIKAKNLVVLPSFPKESTRAFYNSCDACLVPLAPFEILQETVPSKIFEIMACARPVIASLRGEGATIVTRSGGGVTAEPGDAESIAAEILRLRAMGERERGAMGAAGRQYVVENYNRDVLAARYLEILANVARGSLTPRSTGTSAQGGDVRG